MNTDTQLYNSIVKQCKKANKLIDKGYLLLDEDNIICEGKFVFEDRNGEPYIALHKEGSRGWSVFLRKDRYSSFGMETLKEEYTECKNLLAKYTLIPFTNKISFESI